MRLPVRAGLVLVLCAMSLALLPGCGTGVVEYRSAAIEGNEKACGGQDCHPDQVTAQAASVHRDMECTPCHKGTGAEHTKEPTAANAPTDWTIDACAGCHEDEALTYLYDDNAQAGPFGGSIRTPPQPKAATFPEYKTIVAGHAFTRDYNEEGAHAHMLDDHYDIRRPKFEVCLQCKSSKLAYAWKEGKPLRVASDTEITLTHTATEGVPAAKVLVPEGTTITYKTDPVTRHVDANAKLPNGTVYSSKPKPSDDATLSNNMLWASTIAAIKETRPYGAGCNHCHDPHSTKLRLLRKAMLESIEGSGGVKGTGGVNPYEPGSPKDAEKASAKDQQILACAQCHVEYVCGRSGIDKIDRDSFGWAKAKDLHQVYTDQYGYTQDFTNSIMGEPLIKSQHPETELFWSSVHYDAGATCGSCHMPVVMRNGRTFRSHWFTSPYKYSNAALWAAFAQSTGVSANFSANPCVRCHEDRTAWAVEQQSAFFGAQAEVEKLLARSVVAMGRLKAGKKDGSAAYKEALEAHQRAHAIWENLAVSENSMGFHNFEEAMSSMAEAKRLVTVSLEKQKAAAQ